MRRTTRPVAVLLSFALLLLACGDDGGGAATSEPTRDAAVSETTEPGSSQSESDQVTTAVGDDGSEVSSGTFAILELGGDTYKFGTSERTSCDSERLGIMFQAQLDRINDSGESIGDEGILVVLPLTDEGDRTVSVGVDGGSWTAGEGTGGGFDSDTHVVDGSRAEATLTFVSSTGEEVEGSLEVSCAGG